MLRTRKSLNKNRSKLEIIAEILSKMQKPTHGMNIKSHCNISSAQSGRYLNLMTSSGLIRIDETARNVTYQRTGAGRDFLRHYKKMILLLDSSISPPPPI